MRKSIGIAAALLLVVGTITWISGPGGNSAIGFAGGCIRVGLVLGAIWLALPQIQATLARAPRWLLGFFVSKNKQSDQQAGTSGPRAPQPRPRRRSRA
jgi:hypothetical protein